MVAEHGPDAPVPQMAEQFLEVPKIVPQDRILQQTVEQIVDHSKATRADLAEGEKSLVTLVASQAAGRSSCTQVASDHEASVKVFAEEMKAWAEATQVLQSETDGADGHTYSLFQENSSAALQTSTDFKGFDMMTAVRRLTEQKHFAVLAQLRSRISAITKFGAGVDGDPFVKVKDLITDLIRLQAEASPETNQKSHCDEETSKATEKEDLEAAVVEDRDLLSVAYKNAVDSRRAAWRVITSIEQKKKSKSEEQLASYAREYIAKVENDLQKIREGVLALMDKKLVPSPSTDESKAFYYKMKSDYYRYLAEFATGETKSKAGEDACVAYAKATEIAEKNLVVTHPVRLAMAPSPSKFQSEVLQNPDNVADGMHVGKNDLDDVSVVAQRQIPMVQSTRALQCIDKVVDNQVMQVPQVAEQDTEVPKTSSRDRTSQRSVEQIIETPAISLPGRIVEMPVQTKEKTRQITNPQVQHVVKTVEAEMPNIIKETVQRKWPVTNEKINQVTKHPEVPQVQVSEKAVEIPQFHIVGQIDEIPEIWTDVDTQQSSSSQPQFLQLFRKIPKRATAIEHASPRQHRCAGRNTEALR